MPDMKKIITGVALVAALIVATPTVSQAKVNIHGKSKAARTHQGLISRCDTMSTVPNVVGLDPDAAKSQLRSAGYMNVDTVIQKEAQTWDIVVSQRPAAGTVLSVCSTVTIVLGE